ncbi:hypothetical protein VC83_04913 [Pseudogymnoascus destructans]|uniref:Uncharacterized protein n=1 Tax=Pseudogymnoascus destructans TaxID=655981 RepID=A0A177AB81_9PEZI|nr:uncharacterized protein VC83_04913 [Pseudogymnoascus destructans]OAF58672.1 hypothetical protein VC83_04913 [Pseudogymnoascus destructans]
MAGDNTGSIVGSKGKVATEPTIEAPQAHPSDKLKIAFPDTFHGDRKKLKSFIIQTELWMAFNAKHFNKEVEQCHTDIRCTQFAIKLKSKLGNLLLKPTSHYTYFGLSHQQQEQYYSTIATTIYDSLHVIAP